MTRRITLFSLFVIGLLVVAGTLSLLWLSGDDAATTDGPSRQPAYRTGPFQLGIELDPATPRVGNNTLTLVLLDSTGRPVSGAAIKAVAEMPAMGAMPAMRAPADMAEIEPGLYRGTFEPSMEGSWPLTLQISKEGVGSTRASFDLATGRKGLQPAGGVTALAQEAGGAASADELSYRSGPYHLDVSIEPTTPRVGENILSVVLRNADGDPLENAEIKAVAEMPAMGAMPAMRAPADMVEIEPGGYRGTFEPSMAGSWPLTLRIQAPDMPARQISFDLATGREGLQLASGATRTDGGGMAEEAPPGTVTLDNRRRQLIGVETAEAQTMAMTRTIRAEGRIAYDETRLADVSLKFDAWIGQLHANYVGVRVEKGAPLFTVYGPALLAAQQEYLELKRRSGASRTLQTAARKRLSLWDMTATEIATLEKQGEPYDYVTMHAPISGTVVAKNVVEGTAHKAGMTLLRIADLSQVWVEADIYEGELPLVTAGMPVTVTLPYLPGEQFEGRIDYIYPYLDSASRTGRVRLTVANPEGRLKPGMYAEVKLKADLGRRVAVPEEAVIIAGELRVVFEDLGEGRLAPRKVQTGQRAGGFIEIIEGIEAGDRVVTSGNFLIASESRLKAGMEQW
ncbi:efflux RND transporter periplasmic adaptor subunit [Spongiibacter tropicus]|uniref:efflux RND transporter periplasmic adaptor subunit n=1 Tax=Spongiibacter tropicus TaxID=454602 RepID=UPI000C6A661C|nr:efflux RND transporter periplasmic adaptor subunit [Spongiibacter tropicus]MBP53062.1 efflux transporter periplasmic adaptor subunit [Marinobacter sp.]|tara:strand:+ start:5524 stop:7398 length:1875 start_codon:yes stop_codon:yes gene_type:complete